MPHFQRGNAQLYYEDVGEGPAILTTHGVTENHLYWILPGVVDRLVAAGFRVVSTDMRAHGYTRVEGEPKGYDVETVASDFGALADHLKIERFHLLTHATGGMAGLRYAMGNHKRLLSLMSTDTGAATAPGDRAAENRDPAVRFDKRDLATGNTMAGGMRGKTWDEIIPRSRAAAKQNRFMNSVHMSVNPVAAFAWIEACQRIGDPDTLADFMTGFYDDPDPYLARLRQISCPCLALIGENDHLFIKPMEQLAREIPNCKHVVLKGRGHMTALEDPGRTSGELIGFLRAL